MFCTLTSLTLNKLILMFLTQIAIFVQTTFIDLIFPYPIPFNIQFFITQYLLPLWNNFLSN